MKKKNIQEKKLDIVFILDKSGSMSGSEESTISSFNEYIQREKKNNFPTKITTLLFSNSYHYLHKRVDIQSVKKLTHKEYYVGGCTALYDSIGQAITYIDHCATDKVMFVIITDGYENASKEYKKENIRSMIKNHKNYQFIYIGADIDSYAAGGEIGIDKNHIANYRKDKKGTSLLFESLGKASACMVEEDCLVGSSWKEELESYLDENNA